MTSPTPARTRYLRLRSAVRSPAVWLGVVTWGSLVAFVVLAVGLPLVGVGTFLNTETLDQFAPWASVAHSTAGVKNAYLGDTVDTVAPQGSLLVTLARHGVFGAWNPYLGGGTTLGGVPDAGLYSPLAVPWWVLPLYWAPAIVKLLEIVTITVGMSLFLRRLRVRSQVWPVASLIFAASGFMIAWTNWPQTRVAAFIPLMFWALDRAAVERRLRDILAVGLVLGAMVLGGFPAVVMYTLVVGGIYVLVRALFVGGRARSLLRAVGVAVAGVLFGVLVTAWQVIPFALGTLTVVNFGARNQSGGAGALGWRDLLTMYLPDALGYHASLVAWNESALNPIEGFAFVGVGGVVLAVVALVIRGRDTPRGVVVLLACLAGASIVVVYGGGTPLALLQHLPLFNSNPIGRWQSVIGFLIAALAALGLNAVLDGTTLVEEWRALAAGPRWRLVVRGVGALVAIGLGLLAATEALRALGKVPIAYHRYVKIELAATAVAAIVLVVVALLARVNRGTWARVIAGVAAALIVLVPAVQVAHAWWQPGAGKDLYPATPATSFLQKHLGQQRAATVGTALLPGVASAYEIRTLGGHTFQTAQWADLENAVDPGSFLNPTFSTLTSTHLPQSMRSPILDRLGVSYVVSEPGDPVLGIAGAAAPPVASGAVSDGQTVRTDTFSGPVRGIVVTLPAGASDPRDGLTIKVSVVSAASGATLASTSTWVASLGAGPRTVALAGDDIPVGEKWYAQLSFSGVAAPVAVGEARDGTLAASLTVPAPGDGISIVHTGDATIYHRSTALPRVRWAAKAVAFGSEKATVRALASGSVAPDEVALAGSAPPASSGASHGKVTVLPSDVNHVKARVSASGAGWLVVADSLQQPGWSATVDGKPAVIRQADAALGAVYVPQAGTHTIVLTYTAPGLRLGLVVSAATVLATAGLTALGLTRRRRRARGARPAPGSLSQAG